MQNEQFDTLVRVLSGAATRRGVLGVAAGVAGMLVTETAAKRRGRSKSVSKQGSTGTRSKSTPLINIRPTCPENPPDRISLLSASGPGYWWDHTDLTAAVQADGNAEDDLIAAVHAAIATWNDILRAAFGGRITLKDVTGDLPAAHKADIVLHYVPSAGGVSFAGYAKCGDHKCNNVIVSSDPPRPLGEAQYTPEYLGWLALHELGHALGLGHARPLEETNDLMGYGWPEVVDHPVLSQCDLEGIKAAFAWVFEGVAPHPPTVASIDCRELCP